MMPTQQLPVQSSGDALVAALVRDRAHALIWFARQLSTCVEDAEDAAMRQLKPQERDALGLRAIGLSYAEICDAMAWTYTRCNRSITEGRRALRDRLDADVPQHSAAA